MDKLVASDPEQRQEQHDIYAQLVEVEKAVEAASWLVDGQLKEREAYATKHDSCLNVQKNYCESPQETHKGVAEGISQSRELKQLIENHIEW